MIQVKNYFNITFKLQQLIFTNQFNVVFFKLQLLNLNLAGQSHTHPKYLRDLPNTKSPSISLGILSIFSTKVWA